MTDKAEDQAKQEDHAKAPRGRQKQEDQAKQEDGHLIAMSKAGETIKVHPTCVADHKRLGWEARG